jgi:hypothetical protein
MPLMSFLGLVDSVRCRYKTVTFCQGASQWPCELLQHESFNRILPLLSCNCEITATVACNGGTADFRLYPVYAETRRGKSSRSQIVKVNLLATMADLGSGIAVTTRCFGTVAVTQLTREGLCRQSGREAGRLTFSRILHVLLTSLRNTARCEERAVD